MNRFFTTVAVFTLLLSSCQDDDLFKPQNNEEAYQEIKFENINFNEKDKLKEQFGRSLALALKENEALRAFIKNEALKKFDLDYDVMYQLVKNKPLNNNILFKSSSSKGSAGSETFRSVLVNYFEDEADLIAIENQLPLLTIFVPELPEDSFSAENWNTATTTPVVGIRLTNANEIPVIDANDNIDYVIEEDVAPGYPIVVVKDNERLQIVTSTSHNLVKSSDILSNSDGLNYRFLDDSFNPRYNRTSNFTSSTNGSGGINNSCVWNGLHEPGRQNTIQQFETNAYNVFNGAVTDFWMRDNIYYQQTPTNTTGKFTGGKYRETITWFKLTGNPELVWNMLADQSNTTGDRDPQRINQNNWTRGHYSAWSDGQFEISVSLEDNSKTRSVVNTYLTLPFAPEDLFAYTHEHVDRRRWGFKRRYYRPVISSTLAVDMSKATLTSSRFQFHNWSLFEYSNNWLFEWKEVDNTVEQSATTATERKFNTNIEASLNGGIGGGNTGGNETKFGLKWGASLEQKESTSRTNKWTVGSDIFGRTQVNFYDKITNLNPCDNSLYPRIYEASNVIFEIRPVQVEW